MQALDRAGADNEVLFRAAVVHALAGRRAEAMAHLRRAIDGGYSRSLAKETEEFGDLRATTEFQELTRTNK